MKTFGWVASSIAILAGIAAVPITASAQAKTAAEVRAIAKDAYVYGFPIVDNYA